MKTTYWMENLAKYLFCILCFLPWNIQAQNPLYNTVTVRFENETLEEALEIVSEITEINFSYNPDHIQSEKRIAVAYKRKTVEYILQDLLGEEVSLKVRGSYIIILGGTSSKKKDKKKVRGQVKSSASHKNIPKATIYEVESLASNLSDKSGEYELEFKSDRPTTFLAISAENHKDTVVEVPVDLEYISIELEPVSSAPESNELLAVDSSSMVNLFVSQQSLTNLQNVKLYEHRPIQLSFVPSVGTNFKMSGLVTNSISLNVLAGYSYGVAGFEAAGIGNIVRKDVRGAQTAGIFNLVGGKVQGMQAAGIFNQSKDSVIGVQSAGIYNISSGPVTGVQNAGIYNHSTGTLNGVQNSGLMNFSHGKLNGLQLAGLGNIQRKSASGMQASGFFNIATDTLEGLQLAGFLNIASQINGAQFGGFYNQAKRVKGAQISGFSSYISDTLQGLQMAGFVNKAKVVRGFQISVFNFCDTVETGASIGFLSFVKRGLKSLSISSNSVQHGLIQFRTGSQRFYNILSAGYHHNSTPLLSYGYGIGTRFPIKKSKWSLAIEVNSHSLTTTSSWNNELDMINQFHPSFIYQAKKHLAISMGPVFNIYVSQHFDADNSRYGRKFSIPSFYDETRNNTNTQMWIGYQVGLHF